MANEATAKQADRLVLKCTVSHVEKIGSGAQIRLDSKWETNLGDAQLVAKDIPGSLSWTLPVNSPAAMNYFHPGDVVYITVDKQNHFTP